jgi:hypothetical protein
MELNIEPLLSNTSDQLFQHLAFKLVQSLFRNSAFCRCSHWLSRRLRSRLQKRYCAGSECGVQQINFLSWLASKTGNFNEFLYSLENKHPAKLFAVVSFSPDWSNSSSFECSSQRTQVQTASRCLNSPSFPASHYIFLSCLFYFTIFLCSFLFEPPPI